MNEPTYTRRWLAVVIGIISVFALITHVVGQPLYSGAEVGLMLLMPVLLWGVHHHN